MIPPHEFLFLFGQWLPALSAPVVAGLGIILVVIILLALLGKVPISYNLLNLRVRWRTTALTALAFTLVTALLTVMLAFVNGMYALTEASGHPNNVILLSEGATDEGFSNFGFSDVSDISNQPGIARDSDKPLVSRETYLVVNQPIENARPGRPKRRFLQLRGIDDPLIAAQVHQVTLYPGSEWFSEAGVRQAPGGEAGQAVIEVVAGEGIARELGRDRPAAQLAQARNPERLETGDTFELNNRTWLLVGVMQSAGSTFDSEVWAKQSLIGPMFGKETYSTLVARAADAGEAEKLKEFFNTEYKTAAVAAQLEPEYFKSLSETNQQFLVAVVFVTIVLAIGGVFGIMNTMFAAISQRTKDIGVLRLLGFKRRQILIAFLLESLTIALIGGILGIALGAQIHGFTANSIVGGQGGGGKFVVLQMVVDAETIAFGLLLTAITGLVGGLVPSIKAMRLSALAALR